MRDACKSHRPAPCMVLTAGHVCSYNFSSDPRNLQRSSAQMYTQCGRWAWPASSATTALSFFSLRRGKVFLPSNIPSSFPGPCRVRARFENDDAKSFSSLSHSVEEEEEEKSADSAALAAMTSFVFEFLFDMLFWLALELTSCAFFKAAIPSLRCVSFFWNS